MKKIYLFVMLGSFVFAACRKSDTNGPVSCGAPQSNTPATEVDEAVVNASFMNTDADFSRRHSGLNSRVMPH